MGIISTGCGGGLRSISFINAMTGIVTNLNCEIYKTTDGGLSWTNMSQPQYYPDYGFFNISMLTDSTAFISGSSGLLLKTTNGGNNWLQQPVLTTNDLMDISFLNENTGVIAGEVGIVLKTTTGGTIGISNISTEIPSFFILHQNYPNPFNPSTKINFDLPKSGFTSLKVYDIAGKEAAGLVNQNLQAGTYSYDFIGADFSSGIYFYVLKSGDYFEIKKMVLLK